MESTNNSVRGRCQEMVNEICVERDCLNQKQREALGNMLYAWHEEECMEYHGAVDFLWMSDEIDLTTKFELLDLA